LKSENYLDPFLDFLFDVLGHSAGNALDLSRARFDSTSIRSYDMWIASDSEPPERNMHWLLIHLYYLTLKYTPSLTKTWSIDCKSKQTRVAVSSWTERYFSPLVIEDTLDDVSKWAGEQEPTEDEKELQIKVSKRSREVFASYEVDDTNMQIVIRLPAVYPLEGVKVDGVNRVAVDEKKWTSWLMITQAVITFSVSAFLSSLSLFSTSVPSNIYIYISFLSFRTPTNLLPFQNGSITDGLVTFHKNVSGALKGHTECAICYSIISSDKKVPDKRCQTCKNLFHSSCLFKWFASSNQSTCPLCRNPFNYGMVRTEQRRRGGGA